MKKPVKKFDLFAATVFPTEVEHVKNINEITDPELLSIIDTLNTFVNFPERKVKFDQSIDPRKYSRIIKYFETKLQKIDVDAYYAWITNIDYQITTDAIPPEDQQRILREIVEFEPGWFHAASFYRTMLNYKRYLLIRFREKDYGIVKAFLEKNLAFYWENENIEKKIDELTSKFVIRQEADLQRVNSKDIDWLLTVFYNVDISKKNRYQALVAYNLHHITTRQISPMLEPMAALEERLLKGEFYSRRILANFYANKLLLRNFEGDFAAASYCGLQSIKQYTEDYLYYLNNYCSVLMNLNRFDEVLQRSKDSMTFYKSSQDKSRKVIFMANYCRCLNNYLDYKKSIRQAERLIDELGSTIFQYKWHYFFRIYSSALMQANRPDELLRLEKKYKLTEKERSFEFAPYIQLYTLAANFFEMKLPQDQLLKELEKLKNKIYQGERAELQQLFTEVAKLN